MHFSMGSGLYEKDQIPIPKHIKTLEYQSFKIIFDQNE